LPDYAPTDRRPPPEPPKTATDTASAGHETTPQKVGIASGEKTKARDILAAIRTLKNVENEERPATSDEIQALARFCGFGPVALSIFPDPVTGRYKDGWEALGADLATMLSPAEYDSAKRTTFNAFYTSPTVITAIHDAVARLGVPANATILEPGCGTGNFMSYGRPGARFIGIEMDSISGRIAKAIHPEHDIRVENFRDTRLPEDRIDAVVGNVPFADLKLEYQGQKLSLHDFFFAKSVDALKPAGVMALVTTHFTLDKQNAAIREYLASKADFVGAIRLPSEAFKREGTAVVTDIVFLRKRAAGEPADHVDGEWLGVGALSVEGMDVAINRYFLNHPEMVLGTWTRKDTLYGGEGYSVVSAGDLALRLKDAIRRLPQFAAGQASTAQDEPVPLFAPPPPDRYIGEGSFFVGDDRMIYQLQDGKGVPVVHGGKALSSHGTLMGKRLTALVGLRDRARRVLQSQNEGWPESHRDEARGELGRAYDRFDLAYGPINKTTFGAMSDGTVIRRMPNLVKFREDPDAMLVMSLEDYDESTGKAKRAAIMARDVVGRTPPITHVSSAEEGLLVSLNQRGAVDLPFIGTLYDKSKAQIVAELGDLIFPDPESRTWQTADAYLSGNVRAKLVAAERAGPPFARNAKSLAAVQPEDVLPGDIDANLGAPWIPEGDIEAFAAELFHVEPSAIRIAHLKKDAVWSMEEDYAAKASVAATAEYGTERANGTSLLELALNMKTPTIYDTVDHGDGEVRVVNQEETLSAREKQKAIKERFRSWVFAEPDRTERLVRLYNDTYNNLRPRLFDGSHLDFPGMNQALTLRPHQSDAVWRGMSSGNTLLAHVVGAGKTFTMAATGMKMKQAGLIKKPMYVVPNHLLEQFSREFIQLYPNAKLLVAAKEDLSRDRRKFLTAKIASGEWDGIVVTHSSFERIGMSRDYQEKFLLAQIAEYDELLREHAASKGANRNLIKTIEKQKAARAERLKDLLAEDKKDDGLVFDELGVDHVFVDEAHYFKNLETPTKMERVAGIQTGGSERAFDVYMKARYLGEQHAGHGVTFATGTPISNTMVEMFTMQRFLDPEGLASRGLEHFDAWAATFGEVVDTMEITPDGAGLRPRSRFARFTNLPELQQMFRAFTDVQTGEMLNLPRPALETGKPSVIACPMSDEQRALQQELVERYERIRSQKVDPREDNALAITTDGRKLATDARMLSATAPDFPESKVNRLVENVSAIWTRTAAARGTQMIFADMGVNPTAWGYSPYEEIIRKLVAHGIPRDQLAAMGDAESDAKKQALFERVRNGSVRVLIGSTQKMGTGTNVQKRLVALHHLDAPWKPAEVEQRDGRILRQGNENKEVSIHRYVTEGSFDAYMWQALETKARFISQVMTGENAARRAEDIGGQELSYAEVKAIASGNPAVLILAEADAELQRLSVLKKNHLDEQYVARRRVRDLPGSIAGMTERLSNLSSDGATAKAHAGDEIDIRGRRFPREDIPAVLGAALDSLPNRVPEPTRIPLGTYRGLRFGLVFRPQFPTEVYLEGKAMRQDTLSREHQGPRAILNALERLASGYGYACDGIRQDMAIAEGQLRDYQARLGRPFIHEHYLCELTDLRDQLKAGLSGMAQKEGKEEGPGTSELAARIKAIRAANTVEATPERVRQKHSSAAEPITARIRRRTEQVPVFERSTDDVEKKEGRLREMVGMVDKPGRNPVVTASTIVRGPNTR
jgi:N12 class adenine-specific DNA methylase